MKLLRTSLFWLHLIAGCVGGAIIFLMSITGGLLMYERQILASLERGDFKVFAKSSQARPLLMEDLLIAAGVSQPATVTLRSAPGEPVEMNFGPKGIVYIDPYTGRTLGSPPKGPRDFFNQLRGWHRWLAWDGPMRPWGKAITGACTLAFVVIVLSGLYLWIPQVWSWRHVRPILWFRGGLSGKARDFNWHNAIGIWSAVPLLFVILSALPISYPWANDLIYQLTGSALPKANPAPALKGPPVRDGLTRMTEVAMSQPGWRIITFRFGPGDGPVDFTIDRGDGGQPQLKSIVTIDRLTGALVKEEPFESYNLGRRVRLFSRFLHTGESLGLVGQTIAGIVSFGGAVLVWTGIALALRRFRNWRRTRTRQASGSLAREAVST